MTPLLRSIRRCGIAKIVLEFKFPFHHPYKGLRYNVAVSAPSLLHMSKGGRECLLLHKPRFTESVREGLKERQ